MANKQSLRKCHGMCSCVLCLKVVAGGSGYDHFQKSNNKRAHLLCVLRFGM